MNSKNLKIFLSSTYEDLKDARERILKFLGVLNSDLITMEVFGSDESLPTDFCLSKVEECNLFIGIYAERYGTIDNKKDLSLTELEYHTAYSKLQRKELNGLLLYVLHREASWPVRFIDRENAKIVKLSTFKNLISERHTLSFFKDPNELPFDILRDTIRKLEIGSSIPFSPKHQDGILKKEKLDKPIGMEFFNPEHANLFFGREKEIESLTNQILSYNFSLLIGVSGIGKTSLLNAGIIPSLSPFRWKVSLIRPLNAPSRNLKDFLWSQLMEGTLPAHFEFIDVIRTIVEADTNRKHLIIIDQFEDILQSKDSLEVENVISQLIQVFSLKASNLHVLISYRGDVESELGIIWQKISGAADGLPRFYLNPLQESAALVSIQEAAKSLAFSIDSELESIIIQDLKMESSSNGHKGIFPPFLQMVVSTIYENLGSNNYYTVDQYEKLNRSSGIIGNYLYNQLDYLGKDKETGIKILICLVSNYGTKTQKTVEEIEYETLIPQLQLLETISKLIDLRLIRALNNSYEVTHDLLAKSILAGLITDEELNIRKFNFLLESKSAAFSSTRSGLTLSEHLYLYKYRHRISASGEQLKLLINSFICYKAPISYWLNHNQNEIENYYCSEINEYWELINSNNTTQWSTSYSRAPKDISFLPLDSSEIVKLSRGKTEANILAFYEYCIRYLEFHPIDIEKHLQSSQKWKQLLGIVALGQFGKNKDLAKLKDLINKPSSEKEKYLVFRSLISLVKRNKLNTNLTSFITNYKGPYWESLYEELDLTLRPNFSLDDLLDLLIQGYHFSDLNKTVINIIKKIATRADAPVILGFIKSIVLNKSYYTYTFEEYFNLALLFCDDFLYFLDLIKTSKHDLEIKYNSLIHEKIAALARDHHYDYVKTFVENFDYEAQHFSNRVHEEYSIESYNNIYFYTWVLSCAFCNLATDMDKPILFNLLNHKLWTVRNSSARKIGLIGTEEDIEIVLRKSMQYLENKEALTALSYLDYKFYFPSELKEKIDMAKQAISKKYFNHSEPPAL